MHFQVKQPKEKPYNAYELKRKASMQKSYLLDKHQYNGWSNFNTWSVALNIDNKEAYYNASREAIKTGEIHDGESYKEWFKAITETNEPQFFKIDDGWSERELDRDVNWEEIYKIHKEEIQENQNGI